MQSIQTRTPKDKHQLCLHPFASLQVWHESLARNTLKTLCAAVIKWWMIVLSSSSRSDCSHHTSQCIHSIQCERFCKTAITWQVVLRMCHGRLLCVNEDSPTIVVTVGVSQRKKKIHQAAGGVKTTRNHPKLKPPGSWWCQNHSKSPKTVSLPPNPPKTISKVSKTTQNHSRPFKNNPTSAKTASKPPNITSKSSKITSKPPKITRNWHYQAADGVKTTKIAQNWHHQAAGGV